MLKALRAMAAQTGYLPCDGCGREHSCGMRGCAILRGVIRALRLSTSWHKVRSGWSAPKPERVALIEARLTDESGCVVTTMDARAYDLLRSRRTDTEIRALRYSIAPSELGERRQGGSGYMTRDELLDGLARLRNVRGLMLCAGCRYDGGRCEAQDDGCALIGAAQRELVEVIIWHDAERDAPKCAGVYMAQSEHAGADAADARAEYAMTPWRGGAWRCGDGWRVTAWAEMPEEG